MTDVRKTHVTKQLPSDHTAADAARDCVLYSAIVRHFHPHLPPAVNIMSGGAV